MGILQVKQNLTQPRARLTGVDVVDYINFDSNHQHDIVASDSWE
jgi:hypothetical protein